MVFGSLRTAGFIIASLIKEAHRGSFRHFGVGCVLATGVILAGGEAVGDPWRWFALFMPVLGLSLDLLLGAHAIGQRSENTYLRSIVDNLPLLISVRDEQGHVDLVNEPLARQCGVDVQALEHGADRGGQDLPSWVKGPDATKLSGDGLLDAETCSEVENEHGEVRNLLLHHRALQPDPTAPLRCLTVGLDMTDQHQAELSLARGLVAERTQNKLASRERIGCLGHPAWRTRSRSDRLHSRSFVHSGRRSRLR